MGEHNICQSKHSNEMIYTGISGVNRRLILSKINQILVRSQELKQKIITEAKDKVQHIIDMSRNHLKKVEEIEKKYSKIADCILKDDKIYRINLLEENEQKIYRDCTDNSSGSDLNIKEESISHDFPIEKWQFIGLNQESEKKLTNTKNNIIFETKDSESIERLSVEDEKNTEISELYLKNSNILVGNNQLEDDVNQSEDDVNQSEILDQFICVSKNKLKKVELDSYGITKTHIYVNVSIGLEAIFCPLSKNEAFIYGGNGKSICKSYILNLESLAMTQKASSNPRFAAGFTKYQNKIYIFGGCSD